MTELRVYLHLVESGDEISWWAEIPEIPEFSSAAPTVAELKALVDEAFEMEGWPTPVYYLTKDG